MCTCCCCCSGGGGGAFALYKLQSSRYWRVCAARAEAGGRCGYLRRPSSHIRIYPPNQTAQVHAPHTHTRLQQQPVALRCTRYVCYSFTYMFEYMMLYICMRYVIVWLFKSGGKYIWWSSDGTNIALMMLGKSRASNNNIKMFGKLDFIWHKKWLYIFFVCSFSVKPPPPPPHIFSFDWFIYKM